MKLCTANTWCYHTTSRTIGSGHHGNASLGGHSSLHKPDINMPANRGVYFSAETGLRVVQGWGCIVCSRLFKHPFCSTWVSMTTCQNNLARARGGWFFEWSLKVRPSFCSLFGGGSSGCLGGVYIHTSQVLYEWRTWLFNISFCPFQFLWKTKERVFTMGK